MIDPSNIKEIAYRYDMQAMEISLHRAELIQGYNRDKVVMKCSFDVFAKYVKKWIDLSDNKD